MADKRFLTVIAHDPDLTRILDEATARQEALKERFEFIRKAAKDFEDEREAQHKSFWREFEHRLHEMGVMPEGYSDVKHSLSITGGVVFLHDRDGEDEEVKAIQVPNHLIDFFRGLLR